jgi:hypothetical protein
MASDTRARDKGNEPDEQPEPDPESDPVMHTGTDTPAGQRDLAVSEQIALDAGQLPGGPALDDQGQPIQRDVTDTISGQDL